MCIRDSQWKFTSQRPTFYHWATQANRTTAEYLNSCRLAMHQSTVSSTHTLCGSPSFLFLSIMPKNNLIWSYMQKYAISSSSLPGVDFFLAAVLYKVPHLLPFETVLFAWSFCNISFQMPLSSIIPCQYFVSALGVSHVMRYINLRYLLNYPCFTCICIQLHNLVFNTDSLVSSHIQQHHSAAVNG